MTSSIVFFAAALFLGVASGLLRNASLRPDGAAPRRPERLASSPVHDDGYCGSCGDLRHAT